MSSRNNFEAVDRLLKDIMGADDPSLESVLFGGKVVVFGGDFRQILPLVPRGTKSDIIDDCITSSYIWQGVQLLTLVENMRVRGAGTGAADFASKLLAIGNGEAPYDVQVPIPSSWLIDSEKLATLINKIYPNLSNVTDPAFFATRAILTCVNASVDRINDYALSVFPGEATEYHSNDSIIDCDDPTAASLDYPVELLHTMTPAGMPNHTMKIKRGMPLLIVRNLDVEHGLCNGTKVYVVRLLRYSIKVKTFAGNREFLIPRINFTSSESELPFTLRRRQLPVRPAFAMTIHKSQGQTLNHVGVYLNQSVFTRGQLYVALSRATDPANLFVAIPRSDPSTPPATPNVVFREVLL
ncbi:hypothetical protein [Absidia glauca]|uniref:ATP-dependent DNA helicase n=1 Tax=Absidia glauca TaxID=4829 RepID=A0A163JT56_ABSGL|nr:hypothetical protein [Absidia glauca]